MLLLIAWAHLGPPDSFHLQIDSNSWRHSRPDVVTPDPCRPGMDQTFVLDAVDGPREILEAFQPFYRDARLSAVSDPNVVTDLKDALDAFGNHEENEVDAAARAEMFGARLACPAIGSSFAGAVPAVPWFCHPGIERRLVRRCRHKLTFRG